MTTEAKASDVPAIIEGEVAGRTEAIANTAALQIDAANKDAEALARAAEGSHLGTRIQQIEEGNATWRAQMEQNLAEQKAAIQAEIQASQSSILERLSTLQTPPPPTPALPVVSVSAEQEPNLKQPDTTTEQNEKKPAAPPPRLRKVL